MHQSDLEHGATTGSAFADPDLTSSNLPAILLVEDEALVREAAGEVLSAAGYCVLKARNAAEALFVFHRHQERVQLLLTDVVLPDRNGCDLASEIALSDPGLRTIFISGYPENVVTREGFRRQQWFYLPKPFSGASLIEKVREVLHDASPAC